MWFNPSTKDACGLDKGIEPAVRERGYNPMRIDNKEPRTKSTDEILAERRRSRFMVAHSLASLTRSGAASTMRRALRRLWLAGHLAL